MERQNADLQAANNRLLKRARDAEAKGGKSLNAYAAECRASADRWYHDPATGEPIKHNLGERCMLIVGEINEAFEAARTNAADEHLPHRRGLEVEMVDALIRIFDFSAENKLDLDGAYSEKTAYNVVRPDHTHEARLQPNGKRF
jgi:plasmid maintenance system antidote protein VapI